MNNEIKLADLLNEQVPHDESFHSYLLRTQLILEPSALPVGVIGKCGRLIDPPFAHREVEHLFKAHPDHVLLEIMDVDKSIDGRGNQLFDNPSSYAGNIETTFFHGNERRRRIRGYRNIRYCIHCIVDGIEKVGYGYLRHFWYRSNRCFIHNQPLKLLPELGFRNALNALKGILRAQEHESAILIGENSAEPPSLDYKNPVSLMTKFIFPIKFSPCVMRPFASWILMNAQYLDDPDIRNSAYNAARGILCQQKGILRYKEYISFVFLYCASNIPDLLCQFFFDCIDFVGLELGPRYQGFLKEVMAKKKNVNCQNCSNRDCALNGNVKTFSVCSTEMNMQYMMQHSYTLTRVAMQGRPIRLTGHMPWSPIDVYPDSR